MLDAGLITITTTDRGLSVAHFTAAGWQALAAMATSSRQLDPKVYGHVLADIAEHFKGN
jgi:hypothetical protein